MGTIFLDTSALVRRYHRSEPDAETVRQVCRPGRGNTLVVSQLAAIEIASAFGRRSREGSLAEAEFQQLWRLFQVHWLDEYHVVALTGAVVDQAQRLLFNHPLRVYDAAQVGSALVITNDLAIRLEFWTADRRQAQAAVAEGLSVQLIG